MIRKLTTICLLVGSLMHMVSDSHDTTRVARWIEVCTQFLATDGRLCDRTGRSQRPRSGSSFAFTEISADYSIALVGRSAVIVDCLLIDTIFTSVIVEQTIASSATSLNPDLDLSA